MVRSTCLAAVIVGVGVVAAGQAPRPTLYENARLLIGDGTVIERGAFLVDGGRITAVGAAGEVRNGDSAARVDLTGKTVMPAMVNAHVHIGYEGYTSWGAANYSAANVLDHLQREAYYGVGATTSVGTSPTDPSLEFQRDQRAGMFPPASRFFFMPGMAPPGGGPDQVLIKATTVLHSVNEVSTPDEARATVRAIAGKGIRYVKMWVDDRRGTYPKMPPEVFTAIVDEAHAHGMKVHAHATTLPDQKAVVRAGADVVVHVVQNEKLDDEYLALLRDKRPYAATVIGLGDRTDACKDDPFVTDPLPPSVVAAIRATTDAKPLAPYCGPELPNAARREEILHYNLPRMIESGMKLVLSTDAGIEPGHTFGSADHHELARWVNLGVSPAQAIVAATKTPAELLGIDDMGTIAAGKSADFIVLTANPLDDIRNTRQIADVYLRGARLDREALLAGWKKRAVSVMPAVP